MSDESENAQRSSANRGAWTPELKGKTAIVTGAGRLRGIGRSVALEFARQGVNVVLTGTGRSPDRYPADEREIGWRDIESVADEIRAAGAQALPLIVDASHPESGETMVQTAVREFGRVDIIVNNAGAALGDDRANVVDLPLDAWRRVLDTNLTGTFLASKAAARAMIAQGHGGSIINISSIASRLAGPTAAAYSASKAGINALSRTLALELAPHKIRVNALLPGLIETARMDFLGRNEKWQAAQKRVPLGSAGNGGEIAYLCTYLCSDMGAWITGQDIAVDGGKTWH